MTKWVLRCTRCGRTWVLEVSFDLASMGRIYHYCPYCRRNTFHEVVEKIEDEVDEEELRRLVREAEARLSKENTPHAAD